MINLLLTLYRIWRGHQFAQTVAPYDFGSPDDPQAWKSYQIWRRSLGLEA